MNLLTKRALIPTLALSSFCFPMTSTWAGECDDPIDAPTTYPVLDGSTTVGKTIVCPTDTDGEDFDRVYSALMMHQASTNQDFPLYEGSSYDPFDGTTVQVFGPDWAFGDSFYMMSICDAVHTSSTVTVYGQGRQLNSTTVALPDNVAKAIKIVRKALYKAIPTPTFDTLTKVGDDDPHLLTRYTVDLHVGPFQPDLDAIQQQLNDAHTNVTLVRDSLRATLRRRAHGEHSSTNSKDKSGLPDDNSVKWITVPVPNQQPGQEKFVRILVTLPSAGILSKIGSVDERKPANVFDKTWPDIAVGSSTGRHYRYLAEVTFTIKPNDTNKYYAAGVHGKPLRIEYKRNNGHNEIPQNDPEPPTP